MAQSVPAEVNPLIPSTALPTTPTSVASNPAGSFDSNSHLKPNSPPKSNANLSSIASAGLQGSPAASPKSVLPMPMTMTAAAAMHDQRRQQEEKAAMEGQSTSPNPAKEALSSLMGVQDNSISKAKDVPTATNTLSEPLAAVSKTIQVTADDGHQRGNQQQTSPGSASSFNTAEEGTIAPTVTAHTPLASPRSIDERTSPKRKLTADLSPEESNKAFSYPGPLLGVHSSDPRRGMSLPHSGLRQGSPRAQSGKKHKCPYCSTEFTRHHNLKSHLLTHSQEKPYVCQTCQSRFRRLHDLKRHTKLHTGERPHICPKCGRRFARGDALARHNKGQGGCAGRRSSMGSFGGDDDYQEGAGPEDSMDGLVYTNEPERMEEEEEEDRRRKSLPAIKKHDAPVNSQPTPSSGNYQARQPSTYPPIAAGRQPPGGLFPPTTSHGGSSASTSPGSVTATINLTGNTSSTFSPGGPGPVYQQSGMTESPKPLSPGTAGAHHESGLHRNRSPSLTQQFQQQRYGRRTPPPPVSLSHPPLNAAPQLPPPPGVVGPPAPDPRYTLPSQAGSHPPSNLGGPPTQASTGGVSSHSNSLSSHGHSSLGQGSGDTASGMQAAMQSQDQLFAYLRALEAKFDRLQEEVVSLKTQLAAVAPLPSQTR